MHGSSISLICIPNVHGVLKVVQGKSNTSCVFRKVSLFSGLSHTLGYTHSIGYQPFFETSEYLVRFCIDCTNIFLKITTNICDRF